MESIDDTQQDSAFRNIFLLVEFRRQALRFLDIRGRMADDLLAAYGAVSMDGPSPALSNNLSVTHAGTNRTGTVDVEHATYEETQPEDPLVFASEGMVFLRRVEREIKPAMYDRVGFRSVFEAAVPGEFAKVAALMFGSRQRPNWSVTDVRVRFDREQDGWGVLLSIQPVFREDDIGRVYLERMVLNVDQYRRQVPMQEALQLDLQSLADRAQAVAIDFLRG